MHDILIGVDATGKRRETDSMGFIEVTADRYWGAQTQRSQVHFSIGDRNAQARLSRLRLCQKSRGAPIGYIDEKQFDEIVDPRKMIGDGIAES